MTQDHKHNLQRNRSRIVENLNMDDSINYFITSRVLNFREVGQIQSQRTSHNQTELFLDILHTKPDSAYTQFLQVLRDTDQEYIAYLLEPPETGVTSLIAVLLSTLMLFNNNKLECLQRHKGVPVRPTPRCSP